MLLNKKLQVPSFNRCAVYTDHHQQVATQAQLSTSNCPFEMHPRYIKTSEIIKKKNNFKMNC